MFCFDTFDIFFFVLKFFCLFFLYRLIFAKQAIFDVKIALCTVIFQYLKDNVLDETDIHRQVQTHDITIPDEIYIQTKQFNWHKDVPSR